MLAWQSCCRTQHEVVREHLKIQKIFCFKLCEKVSEKGRRALWEGFGGLVRASALSCLLARYAKRLSEKVYKECFAPTVDGAPSTAPSTLGAMERHQL